jgi:hypothetical protein
MVFWSISQNWIICSGTLPQLCSGTYHRTGLYVPEQLFNGVPEHIRAGAYVPGHCLNFVPEHITELDHMFRDNASIVSQSKSQNWIIMFRNNDSNGVLEHITELDHIVPEQ